MDRVISAPFSDFPHRLLFHRLQMQWRDHLHRGAEPCRRQLRHALLLRRQPGLWPAMDRRRPTAFPSIFSAPLWEIDVCGLR